jgi:S-adenosylmethionine hydrolase
VAARLAAGAPLPDAGEPLDPDELTVIELPEPRREAGTLVAHALSVDGYGNVALDAGHDDLGATDLRLGHEVEVEAAGERVAARMASTFADVEAGELLLYEDAWRSLALAVNRGDAAARLGLAVDDEVRLSPC